MSQAKFAAARELIEEHHYTAARAVLKTIDDPKARYWLEQLDTRHQRQQRKRGLIMGVLIGLMLLTGAALLLLYGLPAINSLLPTETPTRTPTTVHLTATPDTSILPAWLFTTPSPN